ncbi:MFS transporter [Naumannella halotolerans]|uniref:MFS transporter n=1 Tax=Naumannella halotolerans TaxID=993414 RepID=A0A4R7J930_9ACTN|nr:MFS transporter [Naumannella halotolerans]TDT34011.1 MFS transporter [Naumannella halotolerans]
MSVTVRAVVLGSVTFMTAELLPTALLPVMAADLAVSEQSIALLITVYAGVAAVLGVPMTIMVRRRSRRGVIIFCLLVLALGQLALALSPSVTVALVSRGVVGAVHTVVFALVPVVAAELADQHRRSGAAGSTFIGTSVAMVAGVPLVAWLGQLLGWRATAIALGVLALGLTVGAGRVLPAGPARNKAGSARTGEVAGSARAGEVAGSARAGEVAGSARAGEVAGSARAGDAGEIDEGVSSHRPGLRAIPG